MLEMKTFCCGLSLKHGTIIIGIVQSILAFIMLVLSAAYAENPREIIDMSDPSIVPDTTVLRATLIVIAVGSALSCAFAILLIFGAETNRPLLLLPWLTWTPMGLISYILATLVAIIHHVPENNKIFIISHLIVAIILCSIVCYKMVIVYSLHKHLRSLNF